MSAKTNIEWCDRTWNPTRGCRRVSPGCERCYAERVAHRFSGPGMPYEGLVEVGRKGPRWNGRGLLSSKALAEPLSWRKPERVFVNSMSDLFFEGFSNEEIAAVFAVMASCPHLTFQVLTKRAKRMREWFEWLPDDGLKWSRLTDAFRRLGSYRPALERRVIESLDAQALRWPLPNVWLGVSVEDQQRANERIPELLKTPAAVRFVSYEPALGPVDFDKVPFAKGCEHIPFNPLVGGGANTSTPWKIRWVIVGGESGPGARAFNPAWAKSVVDQCRAAGVACFVKQMGSNVVGASLSGKGNDPSGWPADLRVREFPKVNEGRAA